MTDKNNHVAVINEHDSEGFLPNFCRAPAVFFVVLISEIFAIILAISTPFPFPLWLNYFAMLSIFILWVALGSVSLLCVSRPFLQRTTLIATTLYCLTIVLMVTAACCFIAFLYQEFLIPSGGALQISLPEFMLRNMAIAAIVTLLALRYLYVQNQWRLRIRAESEAKIEALSARIRPHFFFNSMNTIASLTHSDPEMAEKAVENLSSLFRASMAMDNHSTFEQELLLTKRYVELEKMRLDERLQIKWSIDEQCNKAIIPSLMLQPLLENAIYHGIQTLAEGGTIIVNATCVEQNLRIVVENPCGEQNQHQGNQMAQSNIRQRLELQHGKKAHIVTEEADNIYRVILTLPFCE